MPTSRHEAYIAAQLAARQRATIRANELANAATPEAKQALFDRYVLEDEQLTNDNAANVTSLAKQRRAAVQTYLDWFNSFAPGTPTLEDARKMLASRDG
jgi:hypothetical protein